MNRTRPWIITPAGKQRATGERKYLDWVERGVGTCSTVRVNNEFDASVSLRAGLLCITLRAPLVVYRRREWLAPLGVRRGLGARVIKV